MSDSSNLVQCPFCKGITATRLVPPEPANKFLLTTYDSKTNNVFATTGFSVDAYGCGSCKKVWLENSALKFVEE
ncbi:MAG: hypothetical protein ABF991_13600 [Liquorilactobacillus hordei]|uniref:hypothetical protein n=1 Tax=Liquorilactobacillus hordei TaxID=468911 RepID=UPI0039E9BF5A